MLLPRGVTTRALGEADAHAVYEVMAAQERADIGRVEIEEADIIGDWQRPSFDIAASTVGVFDGERLLGYAELSGADRGDAAVHPDARGRGIGSWLASWMQELAAERGLTVIGMPVPQGSPGDLLLASLGYQIRWTSWVLQLPAGADVAPRELPSGYAVDEARSDQYRAMHQVVEDAFLEWSVRDRETFEDFEAGVLERPGFAPWNLRLVTDPADNVVAVAVLMMAEREDAPGVFEAFVSRLATRADHRGRGLAQALLVDAFAVGRAHGSTTFGLSTDSRTGALGLYEKVGMQVVDVWVNRAISTTGAEAAR